jgi:hypothetical protein
MFPLKNDMDDFTEQKKEIGSFNNFGVGSREDLSKKNLINPQAILPGL